MPTLTTQQRTDLQAELTANDVEGFYTLLASYGDTYAALGLAVTNNDTWQGELANNFAKRGAADDSVDLSYGSGAWLQLNKDVAQGYLNAYNTNNGTPPTREQIQGAHNDAYDLAGLDSDDWLPNKLLNDSGDPDALWADFVTNEGAGDLIQDAWTVAKDNIFTLSLPPLLLAAAAADFEGLVASAEYSDNLLNAMKDMSSAAKAGMASDFTGTDLEDVLDLLGLVEGVGGFFAQIPAIMGNIGSLKDVPEWAGGVVDAFEDAEATSSPLVLDLAGTGINLAALDGEGSVYWNITETDFAHAAGWIAEGTGLLAIDLNENGIIDDHSELFGTLTTDGFTILSAYDTNTDDAITSADDDWDDLLVWTDDNSDGFSQAEELHTLGELLITSINLNASSVNYDIAGNHISHESTFTIDGNTHDIVDAWFAYDTTNTVYVGSYDLDPRVLFLPTLRGYGNLPDLHIAMSMDEDLLDLVQEIVVADASDMSDPAFDYTGKVRDMLFRWAGVDDVDPGSRGIYIDARYLEFLEEFVGRDWIQGGTFENPNGSWPVPILMDAFALALEAVVERLTAQVDAALFNDAPIYDLVTDEVMLSSAALNFEHIEDIVTLGSGSNDETLYTWLGIAKKIEVLAGIDNLSQGDTEDLEILIAESGSPYNLTLAWLQDQILTPAVSAGDDFAFGTSSGEMISGGNGNDLLFGMAGSDTLHGNADNDVLDGGTGTDYLYGGAGNDTYVIAPGFGNYTGSATPDYISENASEGTDTLRITGGVEVDDVRMWTSTIGSLFIQFTADADDRIQIFGPNVGSSGNQVGSRLEQIVFDDETVIDLTAGLLLIDTDDGHAILGSDGADIIDGRGGNDNLHGYAGDDTLMFSTGFDTVADTSGTDILWITGGATVNDISFSNVSTFHTDITVTPSTNVVTVINLRHTTTSNHIETIKFDDGFFANLPSYQSWLKGTSGNDIVAGNGSANVLIGFAGNDDIDAGAGNDQAHGGTGNDDIHGDGGDDLLHGGTGEDVLYGDDGLDILFGGAGADTFVFDAANAFNDVDVVSDFSTGESDVIDIADVLDGYYTYGVDTLTDFVQITDNGTDSTLAIDQDGTANGSNYVAVATILGVTGLTDEVALETGGYLLAA